MYYWILYIIRFIFVFVHKESDSRIMRHFYENEEFFFFLITQDQERNVSHLHNQFGWPKFYTLSYNLKTRNPNFLFSYLGHWREGGHLDYNFDCHSSRTALWLQDDSSKCWQQCWGACQLRNEYFYSGRVAHCCHYKMLLSWGLRGDTFLLCDL